MRRHGFQRPFGYAQIGSWIFAAYIFISAIVTIASTLQEEKHLKDGDQSDISDTGIAVLSAIYLIFYAAMIISAILVTLSDPSDPSVHLERTVEKEKQT